MMKSNTSAKNSVHVRQKMDIPLPHVANAQVHSCVHPVRGKQK